MNSDESLRFSLSLYQVDWWFFSFFFTIPWVGVMEGVDWRNKMDIGKGSGGPQVREDLLEQS